MTEKAPRPEREARGWEEHRSEQQRAWLRLTYRQRLEWLEGAKRFAARALEAARLRRECPGG
jgi:hypothetical protein